MVMLDIETMGLRQDSYVWEIGAILFKGYPDFTPISDKVWHLQRPPGARLDPKTLEWTSKLENGPDRLQAFVHAFANGLTVRDWIVDYEKWLLNHLPGEQPRDPHVWVWGPHFDISMLENTIQQSLGPDVRAPWSYKKPMDLRTLDRLFSFMNPGAPEKDKDQVPHDALGDCRLQLERLKLLFEFFGERILE